MDKISIIVCAAHWKTLLRPYTKTVRAACETALLSALSLWERGGASQGEGDVGEKKVSGRPRPHPNPLPEGEGIDYEITIVLADDAFIQKLNKTYRGKNKPTNVLSFPGEDNHLGDIVLALETIGKEARAQQKTFRDHATHLIVHGVLHLLGYDHESPKEAEAMEQKEIKILEKLGISNPYL